LSSSQGQILHGSAKTTHAIRGELQRSQASLASLAKRYGINEKTVLKWRHRQSVEDLPMGPKERRGTVLSPMGGEVSDRRGTDGHTATKRLAPRNAAQIPSQAAQPV
jgi:transposase-like protein